jgi:transposase-like protein
MTNRRRYMAEEKVRILREVLEKNVPISKVADKYGGAFQRHL